MVASCRMLSVECLSETLITKSVEVSAALDAPKSLTHHHLAELRGLWEVSRLRLTQTGCMLQALWAWTHEEVLQVPSSGLGALSAIACDVAATETVDAHR